MGWTYIQKDFGRKALAVIEAEYGASTIVAKSATREAVFLVIKRPADAYAASIYEVDADGTYRGIAVIAIKSTPKAKDGYNFGWKDMSESEGPYGCPAPKSIIAAASKLKPLPAGIPDNEFNALRSATNYRLGSIASADLKAKKRGLRNGDTIVLAKKIKYVGAGERDTFQIRKIGRKVRFYADGSYFGVPASFLEGATIVAAPVIERVNA
jgi:hypothetical protein